MSPRKVFIPAWRDDDGNIFILRGLHDTFDSARKALDAQAPHVLRMHMLGYNIADPCEAWDAGTAIYSNGVFAINKELGPILLLSGPAWDQAWIDGQIDATIH